MKTNCQNLAWGGLRYESPVLETIEISVENIICGDSLVGGAGYNGDDYDLGTI